MPSCVNSGKYPADWYLSLPTICPAIKILISYPLGYSSPASHSCPLQGNANIQFNSNSHLTLSASTSPLPCFPMITQYQSCPYSTPYPRSHYSGGASFVVSRHLHPNPPSSKGRHYLIVTPLHWG